MRKSVERRRRSRPEGFEKRTLKIQKTDTIFVTVFKSLGHPSGTPIGSYWAPLGAPFCHLRISILVPDVSSDVPKVKLRPKGTPKLPWASPQATMAPYQLRSATLFRLRARRSLHRRRSRAKAMYKSSRNITSKRTPRDKKNATLMDEPSVAHQCCPQQGNVRVHSARRSSTKARWRPVSPSQHWWATNVANISVQTPLRQRVRRMTRVVFITVAFFLSRRACHDIPLPRQSMPLPQLLLRL